MSPPVDHPTPLTVSYGPNPAQVLDIFGATLSNSLPVVLFVGGHSLFHLAPSEAADFSAFLTRLSKRGAIAFSIGFRRGREAVYPSGMMDIAGSVDWIKGRVHEIGCDFAGVSLIGYAAGATHAASYAYDTRAHAGSVLVRKLILLDPKLVDEPSNPQDEALAYYGSADMARSLNPTNFADQTSAPTLVISSRSTSTDTGILQLTKRLGGNPDLLKIVRCETGGGTLLRPRSKEAERELDQHLTTFLSLKGSGSSRE